MAGIAGTIDLRRSIEPAAPLVRSMLATLAHRGPDGELVVGDGPATLGARVLAVLDGAEPPTALGPLRLVLDGDILNGLEVAVSLRARGRPIDGSSQAETLLAAWAEWGPGCLERLEGTFAFALWDGSEQRLHLGRDRLGSRPLYYTSAAGRFRFASEIKALLADDAVPRVPDDLRVRQYLAFGVADHTEDTMLRGIRQVPAASYAVVSPERGVESVRRWHTWRAAPADGPVGERVRSLLEDAVALRLRGGGVVGATLSGGLDSSSVLATAALLRRRAGQEPPLAVVARTADPRPRRVAVRERPARALRHPVRPGAARRGGARPRLRRVRAVAGRALPQPERVRPLAHARRRPEGGDRGRPRGPVGRALRRARLLVSPVLLRHAAARPGRRRRPGARRPAPRPGRAGRPARSSISRSCSRPGARARRPQGRAGLAAAAAQGSSRARSLRAGSSRSRCSR